MLAPERVASCFLLASCLPAAPRPGKWWCGKSQAAAQCQCGHPPPLLLPPAATLPPPPPPPLIGPDVASLPCLQGVDKYENEVSS